MIKKDIENFKKGDVIYKITDFGILPNIISKINLDGYYGYITFENGYRISVSPTKNSKDTLYFLTKEEAEKTLIDREKLKEKKKKLYEYECKINKELGIETFLIKY